MNLPNSDNQDFGNYSKRVARNNPKVTNDPPEEIKILPPDKIENDTRIENMA